VSFASAKSFIVIGLILSGNFRRRSSDSCLSRVFGGDHVDIARLQDGENHQKIDGNFRRLPSHEIAREIFLIDQMPALND